MDDLATPYIFVEYLRYNLEAGESVMAIGKRYVKEHDDGFSVLVERWVVQAQMQNYNAGDFQRKLPLYRKSIFDLLDLARNGISIVEPLKAMEKEMVQVCEYDLGRHIDKLPFKLMIPMLFLQFPAVLMLVIGPLLIRFFAEVGS